MGAEYVHQELNQDVQSISGTYTPMKELRLRENSREVLCVVGQAIVDTACCGSGNFMYATVPGYVVKWKERTNDLGLPVSIVEPIEVESVKSEVARTLKETEQVFNINFW